jgi:phosphohistidine phosphatase SixA
MSLTLFDGLIFFIYKETELNMIFLASDHDRPLSKSGRAEAISVSDKLEQMGWIPELILCRCVPRLY